ncbi:glycosyltransferase [Rhizobacter sp. Root16D2]|uniref:glycosyltransferase n=1 Tax=Rhizobacter sp. Root16D2 TaxID=1736479 RepID=UPI0006FF4FE3|nr:glycosyltransferase [Rhizobacter sp. Root16D2]KRB14366.1 glycosyl transferase [Rhizobacter sp. Root16D2]
MHLVAFSHLRWNFVYQRPQHLLSRLALRYPVLFVEEPMKDASEARLEVTTPAPGITVLRPHTPVEAPGFHDDQLAAVLPLLRAYLENQGITDYAAWFYTPMALPLIAELEPRAVIFDCMDELSAFRDAPRQLHQRESALMKRADLVLTGGPSLYAAKRHLNPNVMCLPSAVDAAHYAPRCAAERHDLVREAEELQAGVPGPRLGFFGVIDERLDIGLIAALADAHPAWQIVMVGPVVKIDPASLPQRPNIAWLGQQPYALLPQLVRSWDVCLLPFALNEATRFISPTKTLEYMAAEKPVVSTAVHDVVELYGDLVRIGRDAASFIDACADALDETANEHEARVGRMNERVAMYSWDRTAETIVRAIGDVVRPVPVQAANTALEPVQAIVAQRPAAGGAALAVAKTI